MKLWKISENGADHTIVAANDAEALGLWVAHYIKVNGDQLPDERPEIEPYVPHEEYTFAPWGDERKLKATAAEWLDLFPFPAYLGCSEF